MTGACWSRSAAATRRPGLVPAVARWLGEGKPVVLASRCPHGEVAPLYAFDGGGARLMAMGVIPAGPRTPSQARMELAIALSAGVGVRRERRARDGMTFPASLPIPDEVLEIAQRLEEAGHAVWCVGGAIRDALLREREEGPHLEPSDLDFATSATPDEVQALFRRTVGVGSSTAPWACSTAGAPCTR